MAIHRLSKCSLYWDNDYANWGALRCIFTRLMVQQDANLQLLWFKLQKIDECDDLWFHLYAQMNLHN